MNSFSPIDGVFYNLQPLQKDDMYGPVVDRNKHIYYLNPCHRTHGNSTCVGTSIMDIFYIEREVCVGYVAAVYIYISECVGYADII